MKFFITKKRAKLISLLFTLILLLSFSVYCINARDKFYKEYAKHKEIIYLLANYKTKTKTELNEERLRNLIMNNGAELKAITKLSEGFEIRGKKLSGIKVPQFVFSLEEEGFEIVKFKAVDNTGSGIFEFEIVLR